MNPIAHIKAYMISSYAELKKVTWPTRAEATRYTIVVVALSLGVGAFFGVVDYVLTLGLEKVLLR